MNAIGLYRRMARLRRGGLSEMEIAVRCRVRNWTVSRILGLRTMEDSVMRLFAGCGMVTMAALMEIASWPVEVQRAALGDFVRLVNRSGARMVSRPDVARVLIRHGRDLDRAPFPTSSCRACAKRTGAQADFFGDVDPGRLGRCLDAACFARCMNAVAARRARWRKKESTGNVARSEKEKQ